LWRDRTCIASRRIARNMAGASGAHAFGLGADGLGLLAVSCVLERHIPVPEPW
jgi:hypothetical protein